MIRHHRSIFLLGIGLVLLGFTTASAQNPFEGSWSRTLSAGGTELRVVFHLKQEGDSLTGTMDSPDQGATGIPISEVTVLGDSLDLKVKRLGATYRGMLTNSGDTIDGRWTQQGQSFPLRLTPEEERALTSPPRPQHPEPPYPYATADVTFRNESAGIKLAGTFTRPREGGSHPAVVLISGSGPQGRDSEVYNHKLFHVLADHLTRHGIAVLRYDERGVGRSEGSFREATPEDFATDVAAAVRFLKQRPAVDTSSIGLVGMSEGGFVAPMVHTWLEPVDFLVTMAGPSVPGRELLVEQAAELVSARGAPTSAVDSVRIEQRKIMSAIHMASDSAEAAEEVRTILERQGVEEDRLSSRVGKLTDPAFRFLVRYNPAPTLRKLDVPVLALYGSKDRQVPARQNAGPMRTALQKAPSEDTTVRVMNGLNHLFQPAETGLPEEYGRIETTMSPTALNAVSSRIQERAR